MMIFLSFFSLRFWHSTAYIFYIIVLGFLIWASLYGVTASGSQRWINLHFINLQPSELMKIAIIICFARFFHREQLTNINSLKNILLSITILILPLISCSARLPVYVLMIGAFIPDIYLYDFISCNINILYDITLHYLTLH